jgi:organic hydroperoxide reductase OsmC/OhrA
VEKTPNGLRFIEVCVKARVSLADVGQTEEVGGLAELAEKYCLISNALACPVHYDVEVNA